MSKKFISPLMSHERDNGKIVSARFITSDAKALKGLGITSDIKVLKQEVVEGMANYELTKHQNDPVFKALQHTHNLI